MSFSVPDFEQRLSNLQEQLDRLGRLSGGAPGQSEQRFALLVDQIAEIVRRWSVVSDRNARVVSRFEADLGEWSATGVRLQEDTAQRLQELEARLQREWHELREGYEEPVRQLHDHATSLTQVSMATASSVEQHFGRSEARLTAIQEEIGSRLADLSRDMQAMSIEIRGLQPSIVPPPVDTSRPSIETIVESSDTLASSAAEQPVPVSGAALNALTTRFAALERTLAERGAEMRAASQQAARDLRIWRFGLVLVALLTLASGIVLWRLRQDVMATTTRVEDARLERSAITDTAARETATASDAAARALKEATEHTEQARLISVVLSAPDVVRYDLAGRDSLAGAIAQLRWSRSRGLVFSGSRISPPPADNRYQIWLLTRAAPVKTATFVPDDTGVITIAVPFPETAGAIIGAMVTTEPAGGSDTPTGTPVLARPLEADRQPPLQQ